MIDLIVTRHQGLVDHLIAIGLAPEGVKVISHATAEDVTGKHVCGVLPHSLSCLTSLFTEVPLALTPEMRGLELDHSMVKAVAGEPVTYRIERV